MFPIQLLDAVVGHDGSSWVAGNRLLQVLGVLDRRGELFLTEDAQRGRRHSLRGEPEMLQDCTARTGRAVTVDTDDGATLADEALPAQSDARLDGDARCSSRAEDPFAIGASSR